MGHCRLWGHLKTLGVEENGMYTLCEDDEEIPINLLIDCEATYVLQEEWMLKKTAFDLLIDIDR